MKLINLVSIVIIIDSALAKALPKPQGAKAAPGGQPS